MIVATIGLLSQRLAVKTVDSVQVYDSIFPSVADETVSVINNFFAVTDTTRTKAKKMQHQRVSKDCGVFAIAVCTALLNGVYVSIVAFSQDKMRSLGFMFHCKVTNFLSHIINQFIHMHAISNN